MGLAIRDITTGNFAAGALSRDVTVPAGLQADDLILLSWWCDNADSITPPDGTWSIVEDIARDPEASRYVAVFSRFAVGGESGSWTFDFDDTSQSAYGCIAWYSAAGLEIQIDDSAAQYNTPDDTSHEAPSVTTTQPNAQLHVFTAVDLNAGDFTGHAEGTEQWDISSSAHLLHLGTEQIASAGATGTRTVSTDNSVESKIICVAIVELLPPPTSDPDVIVLLDEWLLGGQTAAVDLSVGNQPYETTTISASAGEYEMLPGASRMALRGYFRGIGSGYLESEFYTRLALRSGYAGLLLGATLSACVGYVLPGAGAEELQVQAPVKNVMTVNGAWVGAPTGRGLRVLRGNIYEAAAQTGVDFGAAGVAGGVAYLFVQYLIDGTNTTITVQSDSDSGFGSAATEGTFTFSDVGGYEVALSGDIGRYVRANVTSMGGASLIVANMIVCVAGVTY